ncbi:MAG: Lrp/AsnC family transcriptional regulator [Candidatus Eremiobacteraeota bacterium]|nr:Lrp/AsnC family transcriptional regulator [Candidatus Eremiobacteraeota bacterium]
MDEIDRAILRRLKEDARVSFRDLGEAVGLSANAVAERVRRLVSAGTIRGFRAEIDPRAGGARLAAFVDLRLANGTPADAFEAALRAMPGVVSASLTTGNFDYTLRVAVADEPALVALIEALRGRGASETHSRIILRETMLP